MRNPFTPCTACGREIAATASFCSFCGAARRPPDSDGRRPRAGGGPEGEWPWSLGETLVGLFFVLSLSYALLWALFSVLRRNLGI